jgi:surfactin synthase thioesterase subunit
MSSPFRLFCLPFAGGSAIRIYSGWKRQLPPGIEVIPLELPGRGTRISETPVPRADALTADALRQVLPWCEEPFALFGHSLGAALAFEMARVLDHQHGRPPAHLLVSGFQAPDAPVPADQAYLLPDPQFRARLRELDGTPREVLDNDDLMDVLLPVLRADFAAIGQWRYRDAPPLSMPITVFGGAADPEVPVPTLDGWRRQTTSSCQVHVLPGNHFFLTEAPGLLLPLVTDRLQRTLPVADHERSR